jgi:ABC-type multidrug transport system ATPase subunit
MRQTILRLHRDLGLTILLSSHLLNEVEQLCSRIAVLNQGRMVFEGTMAATKQREHWVRLRVGDFASATSQLREAQLIKGEREGKLIVLEDGVGTDRVVKFLVERGLPVYEITAEEETLEEFYLGLMNGQREVK